MRLTSSLMHSLHLFSCEFVCVCLNVFVCARVHVCTGTESQRGLSPFEEMDISTFKFSIERGGTSRPSSRAPGEGSPIRGGEKSPLGGRGGSPWPPPAASSSLSLQLPPTIEAHDLLVAEEARGKTTVEEELLDDIGWQIQFETSKARVASQQHSHQPQSRQEAEEDGAVFLWPPPPSSPATTTVAPIPAIAFSTLTSDRGSTSTDTELKRIPSYKFKRPSCIDMQNVHKEEMGQGLPKQDDEENDGMFEVKEEEEEVEVEEEEIEGAERKEVVEAAPVETIATSQPRPDTVLTVISSQSEEVGGNKGVVGGIEKNNPQQQAESVSQNEAMEEVVQGKEQEEALQEAVEEVDGVGVEMTGREVRTQGLRKTDVIRKVVRGVVKELVKEVAKRVDVKVVSREVDGAGDVAKVVDREVRFHVVRPSSDSESRVSSTQNGVTESEHAEMEWTQGGREPKSMLLASASFKIQKGDYDVATIHQIEIGKNIAH